MKRMLLILTMLVSLVISLTACSSKEQPNIELIQDMMQSPSVRAQEYDDFFPDHAGGARVPPANTVPVGFKAYRAGFNPEMAKADRNPMAGQMTDEVLLTGQKYYDTNCMVCHGQKGDGKGPVGLMMPNHPPALTTDKVKGWADGQIFQVITVGQGTMGPYASHIPQQYRWQVVNYIRYLQKTEK